METLTVSVGEGYKILVGKDFLNSVGARIATLQPYSAAAVVTDDTVMPLYAGQVLQSLKNAGIRAELVSVAPGEGSKSLRGLEKLYDFFAKMELTRADVIVYVGGGVVGDLAGFAAATYLRGTDYVAVPTTLLAMLDSSVGGKTAVNLSFGKNMAGAFYQPRAVYIDVETLKTLSKTDFQCGIGEALKYAMIKDPSILTLLDGKNDAATMIALIKKGLAVKIDVVEKDTFDKGVRQTLNFGHTLGHVIEKRSGYTIPHGVAVGLGMLVLTRYAEQKGWTESGTSAVILRILSAYEMPSSYSATVTELFSEAKNDKKRKGNLLTLVLIKNVGECYLKDVEVTNEL